VHQQFNSCRWAAKFENDDLATSLLLHYGWLPDYQIPMRGASIHTIDVIDDGILVKIEYNHYANERFAAACKAISNELCKRKLEKALYQPEALLSTGMSAFYCHKKSYISIPNEYRIGIADKLIIYIEQLINALDARTNDIAIPEIDEPDDILPDDEVLFRWADFEVIDGVTEAQRQQRYDNNKQAVLEAILPKLNGLQRSVELSRTQIPMYDNNIAAAVKYGFITRIGRGKLIINPDIDNNGKETENNDIY
jgi:hypothetical protein